jgi:hypothetical protein
MQNAPSSSAGWWCQTPVGALASSLSSDELELVAVVVSLTAAVRSPARGGEAPTRRQSARAVGAAAATAQATFWLEPIVRGQLSKESNRDGCDGLHIGADRAIPADYCPRAQVPVAADVVLYDHLSIRACCATRDRRGEIASVVLPCNH